LIEYPGLFHLDVVVENEGRCPIRLSPSLFVLLDGHRTQLRQLQPHEATNLLLAKLENVPACQPKYNIRATTSGSATGTVTYTGNTAYGRAYGGSTTNVTVEEDPWNKLGHSIGAGITKSRNQKIVDLASDSIVFDRANVRKKDAAPAVLEEPMTLPVPPAMASTQRSD
jgi:hypothetical protein